MLSLRELIIELDIIFVQVYIDDEHRIDSTNVPSCTCEQGKYRCHHMAVAMLHAYKTVSSTDQMCSWSRPKPSANTNTVQTIRAMYPDSMPAATLDRPVSDADHASLLQSLLQGSKQCAMTWVLTPEPPAPIHTVSTVFEIIKSSNFSMQPSTEEVAEFMEKLCVSREQIEAVEVSTRSQHQNPLWGQYRAGRLTASKFGAVIKCIKSHRKPSMSLLKSLMGEYDASGAKAVQWGIQHENTAVRKYEAEKGVVVKPSGLWLHNRGFCGGSPDGLVDESKLLEVKCPYSARDEDVMHIIGTNFFLHVNDEGAIALNVNNLQGHAYYHQVQANLWLTDRDICDFVVWTPQSTVIFTVERDQQYESKYISALQEFYEQHFIVPYISRCVGLHN